MIIHCSKKLLDVLPKSVKDNFIPNALPRPFMTGRVQHTLSDNANNCPGRIRTKKYEFPLLVMQEKMDELMKQPVPLHSV